MSVILYGAKRSLFTGKVEAYLRAKGIAHEFKAATLKDFSLFRSTTGIVQIPQIVLEDGRWITDSTEIIRYYEEQQPQPEIYCREKLPQFIALLLEEYFDEWFWDVGIYMRFRNKRSGKYIAAELMGELSSGLPIPNSLLTRYFLLNRRRYLKRMGVRPNAEELIFNRFLKWVDNLERIFKQQPFLLGERPTAADFGLFAPMFRHINCDPYSAHLLREQGPAVNEWCARMWNLSPESLSCSEVTTVPENINVFLTGFDQEYLPYLQANIAAYKADKKQFSFKDHCGEHKADRTIATSAYRIWSFNQLQKRFQELPDADKKTLEGYSMLGNTIEMLKTALDVEVPKFPSMPIELSAKAFDRDLMPV